MTRAKGQSLYGWNETKTARFNGLLTPTCKQGLKNLADKHGFSSASEVLEHIARDDGDLVVIPRELLEFWVQESESEKAKTSPRWQRAKELISQVRGFMKPVKRP